MRRGEQCNECQIITRYNAEARAQGILLGRTRKSTGIEIGCLCCPLRHSVSLTTTATRLSPCSIKEYVRWDEWSCCAHIGYLASPQDATESAMTFAMGTGMAAP